MLEAEYIIIRRLWVHGASLSGSLRFSLGCLLIVLNSLTMNPIWISFSQKVNAKTPHGLREKIKIKIQNLLVISSAPGSQQPLALVSSAFIFIIWI